ncbi:aminodeoxychorismate synthase component I [Pseudoalteromonas sp. CO325X]|uniref:aminodeoxychorismate synthase component I n=1 Tax=Pseudoalteromonas sp. CO325X TaxID=1777262 RepID=UPI001022C030|nr:aminodeoxychorismate synthase component I [Pseudoalteromonas sp. CO325X]RZF79823.1 aminodeoxychorismate synthase component I [Pseudoalteromonas sp. CO325X]
MTNSQLHCRKLALSSSPCEVFAQLHHLKGAVFLDSASAAHVNSRFDILVIEPEATLSVEHNKVYLDGVELHQEVFAYMQQRLASLCTQSPAHDLPFSGGWLGYFGYDLGRTLERLPSLAADDIALAQMQLGLYLDALIYDKAASQWYYIAQPTVDVEARLQRYLQPPAAANAGKFALTSDWASNMSQAQYADKFTKIQDYLRSGDCYQINLAQRFSATYQGCEWQAYRRLRSHNSAPFSAFMRLPQGCILSISPERFIEVHHNQVESKPIKGTLPRSSDPKKDEALAAQLASSPKDRAENVMIVDLLRNDLGKVAKPGSVHVPSLFAIESFPAVHHLVSTVQSQLAEGKTALDQLKAAFPGGSITGAPKIRAMEIIEELEPHRRSAYCGSIGYISACGDMDTSITIRTLVAKDNTLHCWAGGGIVADSDVASEYQETYDKVNKILPVLT